MKGIAFAALFMALAVALVAGDAIAQQTQRPADRPTMRQELNQLDRELSQRFGQTDIKYIPSNQQLNIADQHPVIIDVGSQGHYLNKHLKGAVNVPAMELERLVPVIVPDKETPLLIYNSDPQKGSGILSAEALARLGYKKIQVYGGDVETTKLPLDGMSFRQQQQQQPREER